MRWSGAKVNSWTEVMLRNEVRSSVVGGAVGDVEAGSGKVGVKSERR